MCYTNDQAKTILDELNDVLVDYVATGIGGALLDSCPARFKAEKECVKKIFLAILNGDRYDDLIPPGHESSVNNMDWQMCSCCAHKCKCKLYNNHIREEVS